MALIKACLNDVWSVFGGVSYTYGKNKVNVIDSTIDDTENSFHGKLKFKRHFSNRFKLYFGAEYFATNFDEEYSDQFVIPASMDLTITLQQALRKLILFFPKNWP